MVLSVCIPVYNSDVKVLVLAISKQIAINNLPVEIIVLDDASSPDIELINRDALAEITNTRYFSLPENIGKKIKKSWVRKLKNEFYKGFRRLFLPPQEQQVIIKRLRKEWEREHQQKIIR